MGAYRTTTRAPARPETAEVADPPAAMFLWAERRRRLLVWPIPFPPAGGYIPEEETEPATRRGEREGREGFGWGQGKRVAASQADMWVRGGGSRGWIGFDLQAPRTLPCGPRGQGRLPPATCASRARGREEKERKKSNVTKEPNPHPPAGPHRAVTWVRRTDRDFAWYPRVLTRVEGPHAPAGLDRLGWTRSLGSPT